MPQMPGEVAGNGETSARYICNGSSHFVVQAVTGATAPWSFDTPACYNGRGISLDETTLRTTPSRDRNSDSYNKLDVELYTAQHHARIGSPKLFNLTGARSQTL
jgi:hypothetical protein